MKMLLLRNQRTYFKEPIQVLSAEEIKIPGIFEAKLALRKRQAR